MARCLVADLLTAPCQYMLDEGPELAACGDQSAATLTVGCVNEHVRDMRICYGCAAEVQMEGGGWACPRCLSEATLVITWDDETAPPTVVGQLEGEPGGDA